MSTYLGQNFLVDDLVLNNIVFTIDQLYGEFDASAIVEIGPGRGALTKKITHLSKQIICIEKDTTMQHYLDPLVKKHKNINIVYQDVLELDLEKTIKIDEIERIKLGDNLFLDSSRSLIVGNLPYYITSPILRIFFGSVQVKYIGGVFLIQKEVAEKIVYDAPKKSFLRWLINYAYHVEYCFSVPAKAFNPPPKVTSAVIRLVPKLLHQIPKISYETMVLFLDQYSCFKRKTLGAANKIITKLKQTKKSNSKIFDITLFKDKRLEELGRNEMAEIIK